MPISIRRCCIRNVNNSVAASRLLLAGAALSSGCFAHDPITTNLTWSKEISRVVYQHCASCHRPDGRAMPLVTYEDARPWAKAIRDEVLNRRMPPWDAVKGVGEFRDDVSLTQPEIDLIVNWVEGGAPEGNPIYLPPSPKGVWEAERPVHGVAVKESYAASAPVTLRGITPSGPTEVVALLPDGSVKRLLWVKTFRAEWNRTYWLRTPLRLAKGSKVFVYGAGVDLVTSGAP